MRFRFLKVGIVEISIIVHFTTKFAMGDLGFSKSFALTLTVLVLSIAKTKAASAPIPLHLGSNWLKASITPVSFEQLHSLHLKRGEAKLILADVAELATRWLQYSMPGGTMPCRPRAARGGPSLDPLPQPEMTELMWVLPESGIFFWQRRIARTESGAAD